MPEKSKPHCERLLEQGGRPKEGGSKTGTAVQK